MCRVTFRAEGRGGGVTVDALLQGRAAEPASAWTRTGAGLGGKASAEAQFNKVKLPQISSFKHTSPFLMSTRFEAPGSNWNSQRARRRQKTALWVRGVHRMVGAGASASDYVCENVSGAPKPERQSLRDCPVTPVGIGQDHWECEY